jgi:hypothetical protein
MHKQVMVRVNAPVDEGIAPLILALSDIPGVVTMESCQGEAGHSSAFVVFYMDDWRACGELLFDRLLPLMPPDLRSGVSLRIESFDTLIARGWITLDPAAIEPISECVRQLATTTVSQRVLMAGDAHCQEVA